MTLANLPHAAGQFVEDDGWVKVEVSAAFERRPMATRAILCHELCHYVLGAGGVRTEDTADNERLTDVAMFVFGLGQVFLAGYRDQPGMAYRDGHRLGYLNDPEYIQVEQEVARVRSTGELQPARAGALLGQLRNRLGGDDRKVERHLASARQKYPFKTEAERIQAILEDLERR